MTLCEHFTTCCTIPTWIVSHDNGPLYIGTRASVLTQRLIDPFPLGLSNLMGGGANWRKGSLRRMGHSCQEHRVDKDNGQLFV